MLKNFINFKFVFFCLCALLFAREINASQDNKSKKDIGAKNQSSESNILEQIKNQIEELNNKINQLSVDVEKIKYRNSKNFKENNSEINSQNNFDKNTSQENSTSNFLEFDDILIQEEDDSDEYRNTSISTNLNQNSKIGSNESISQIENLYFGSIEKFRSNNFEESELMLEKIIQTSWDDSQKNLEIKANSYFLLGEILYKKPDFEKAASNFLKAYQLFSKINKTHIQSGNSLLRLGQTLYSSGNIKAACKSFSKINSDFKNVDNMLIEISENELARLKCLN